MSDTPPLEAGAPAAPPGPAPERLERRALALLVLLLVLLGGAVAFVLVARGVFEPVQRLVLVADDSEGVQVGMDLTFSGFPIGRVRRIELAPDASVRILVDVPRRDAHWLRSSSVFTLSRGLVGGTAIRAYSGILTDPPLPDGAERRVLAGDATAEIPRILSEVRALVANLTALTAADSSLAGTLAQVHKATTTIEQKLAAPRGAAELLLGPDAPRLAAVLARTDTLLARLDGLVQRTDGVVAQAGERLLGEQGLAGDVQAAVKQLQALLAEARGSLARVDGVLKEAEGVAKNARVASADLGTLRAEVEASLRKVEALVDEVNRRWPLKRDIELRLP